MSIFIAMYVIRLFVQVDFCQAVFCTFFVNRFLGIVENFCTTWCHTCSLLCVSYNYNLGVSVIMKHHIVLLLLLVIYANWINSFDAEYTTCMLTFVDIRTES